MNSKLEKFRDYLIRHKRFIDTIKNGKKEPEYWRGYEDAVAAFENEIEYLLRKEENK